MLINELKIIVTGGAWGMGRYFAETLAAKAALAANTVTWGREFARYGIRVGAIAPGLIRMPMTEGMNQKALDAIQAQIPLRKMGAPVDTWRAVQFIIECDFTARTMDVDGGYSF